MPRTFGEYGEAYEHARMRRSDGVLELELHSGGDSLVWGDAPHTELGYCFADIAADSENRAVILSGVGDAFCQRLDDSWVGGMTPDKWEKIFSHGQRLLVNLLNIEVPVIGIVNGPARVHAELVLLSDIVIGTPTAFLQDAPHFKYGTVPGDGAHIVWQELLGLNRARSFLLLADKISAEDAARSGIYHTVAADVDEAWVLARRHGQMIASKPRTAVRYSRWVLTQRIRAQMHAGLGPGLAVEGLGAFESWPGA